MVAHLQEFYMGGIHVVQAKVNWWKNLTSYISYLRFPGDKSNPLWQGLGFVAGFLTRTTPNLMQLAKRMTIAFSK